MHARPGQEVTFCDTCPALIVTCRQRNGCCTTAKTTICGMMGVCQANAQTPCLPLTCCYQALNERHGISLALQFAAWLALAETPHPLGAERAAALWGAAQPLRAGANRALSPSERREEDAMLIAIGERLGAAARTALLSAGGTTDWTTVLAHSPQAALPGAPSHSIA